MDAITITIESIDLPLRPTPLAKLVKAKAMFTDSHSETEESVDALAEALYHGIRRAKGDVTLDWLKENIDIHNFDYLLETFIRVNGLVPKADAVGEAGAGAAS